jgi:cell division protein FtsW
MSLIEKLKKSNHLKGDPYIWGIVFVLGFIGVLAVYSSTGTLAFAKQQGNTEFYLFRHLGFLVVGFFTMYAIHTVPFKFYAKTSIFLMWISVILLIVALAF